jgi:hypothetical protein
MIELLLAVQAVATAALAVFVIKLRRELYPMLATAGPTDKLLTPLMRLWIRSIDVLVLRTPQFEAAKTVLRMRWAFTEELQLKYSFAVYDVAMQPLSRSFYKRWRAWLSGDDRYRCLVEKPRGLSRLYNKAIDVVCYDMQNERSRRLWEVIEIAERHRRKHKT